MVSKIWLRKAKLLSRKNMTITSKGGGYIYLMPREKVSINILLKALKIMYETRLINTTTWANRDTIIHHIEKHKSSIIYNTPSIKRHILQYNKDVDNYNAGKRSIPPKKPYSSRYRGDTIFKQINRLLIEDFVTVKSKFTSNSRIIRLYKLSDFGVFFLENYIGKK